MQNATNNVWTTRALQREWRAAREQFLKRIPQTFAPVQLEMTGKQQ
jgi:hypothetical protein